MTQDELAAVSGVSKSSISMAERAFHRLPPKEITQIKLAKALGITLRELRQMPSGFEASAALRPPAPAIERNEAKGALPVAASQYNERELSALHLPSKWLLGATDDPESLSYFVVSDASMQPTIKAGDIAIIEPTSTLTAGLLLIGHHDETMFNSWNYAMPFVIAGYDKVGCFMRKHAMTLIAYLTNSQRVGNFLRF